MFFCGNRTFPSEGKLGIKLQATIIKNTLGLLFPVLTSSGSILPASQHNLAHHEIFKLTPGVQTDSYVELCTPAWRKAHQGDTHILYLLSQGFPPQKNYGCHTTSQHSFAYSWIQLTSHVPSKVQGSSQSIALANISRYLVMVSNMQTQLSLLPCCHCTVLSQFWPPLFHWLGTGWLSERGVWTEGEGWKGFSLPNPTPSPPPETNCQKVTRIIKMFITRHLG